VVVLEDPAVNNSSERERKFANAQD
jgi:hypothetical protein